MKNKAPTNKERIEMYENIFNALHFHATVSQDKQKTDKILENIYQWCIANHTKQNANDAFWNLSSH